MTLVPNHEFPVKAILVSDTYKHPKGSPEREHVKRVAYVDQLAKDLKAITKNVERERKGWK